MSDVLSFGGQRLISQQRTAETLTASVINTTETAFAMQVALAANYFSYAGKVLVVTLCYDWVATATVPTFTTRLRTGTAGVILYQGQTSAPGTGATNGGVAEWIIQTPAAPGASVALETGSATPLGCFGRNQVAGVQNVATNAAITLQVSVQFGANTAGNSLTARQLFAEEWS